MKRPLIILNILLSLVLAGITSSCDSAGDYDESDDTDWEQSAESEIVIEDYDDDVDDADGPPAVLNEDQ